MEWLFLALGLTTALWVAGTATQLGSVSVRPPLTQLIAVQVAGSFVNHLVPGGVGGMAVNLRFLQRVGLTRPAAVASVGLNSIATMVTHLLLIAAVWAVAPIVLPRDSSIGLPGRLGSQLAAPGALAVMLPWTVAVLAVALVVGSMLVAGGPAAALLPRRMRDAGASARAHIAGELVAIRPTLRSPGRALLLWGGSAAAPALHAVILIAVFKSLSGGVPALTLGLTYLVASAVAALVPSPGGLGSLDLILTAGLVGTGTPSTTAIAVVLAYRLVTVWAPLVPGGLVLALLVRRRLI